MYGNVGSQHDTVAVIFKLFMADALHLCTPQNISFQRVLPVTEMNSADSLLARISLDCKFDYALFVGGMASVLHWDVGMYV